MRIRNALLAITATLVAGSAIAAPAMAQDFRGHERGYHAAYGYRYDRPRFEHPGYGWAPVYEAPVYGYGFHRHYDGYRPYWR
jgi:hypothetical protein